MQESATVVLQLQQDMKQNQNFALNCFTTPGLTTTVLPSSGTPCPHTPAPPGASHAPSYSPACPACVCMHVPCSAHSSSMPCNTGAPASASSTPSTCPESMLSSSSVHSITGLDTSTPSQSALSPLASPVTTVIGDYDKRESVSSSIPSGALCRLIVLLCSYRYTCI